MIKKKTNTYLRKVTYIYPLFAAMAIATTVALALLRWLLTIRWQVVDINEDVWNFWMPIMLPWLPILLWLNRRTKVLVTKKDPDLGRSVDNFIAWVAMAFMLTNSQQYLTTSTAKIKHLTYVYDIDHGEAVRYYTLKHFAVAKDFGGVHVDSRVSGKHNEDLNITAYFVIPILRDTTEQIVRQPRYWYGVRLSATINNHMSENKKERQFHRLFDMWTRQMEHYDYYALDHFERTPTSTDKQLFITAIPGAFDQGTEADYVILQPVRTSYEERNGNTLLWVFLSFLIGSVVMLVNLIFPAFDQKAYRRMKSGKSTREEEWTILNFLIPRGDHMVTSIIIDINLLVYVITVFGGAHFMSPNVEELMPWGANSGYEVMIDEQWWRLFTSMFLHAGMAHLMLNMIALGFIAIFLEPKLGRTRYTVLYLLSGLCASIVSIAVHPDAASVGASGAIFGLYGAMLAMLLIRNSCNASTKPALIMFGGYVALNLVIGFFIGGIDNAAHIGGLVSGFIFGLVYSLWNMLKSKDV